MGEFFTETHFLGSLGQQQAIDDKKKYLKRDSLFFLPIKKRIKQTSFWLVKKVRYLKKNVAGIAGLVPLRYYAFVVISHALNFPLGYFLDLKFFLMGISWLRFPDCNIFSCWLLSDRNQKYINLKPSILFQIDFNYC